MGWLKLAIGVMTILIVVGVGVIGVTIFHRLASPRLSDTPHVLDEPAGTRITGITSTPAGVALLLQGGGPDRVVVLDLTSAKPSSLVTLRP
jgi:hypothetical protein